LYDQILKGCDFDKPSSKCEALLKDMDKAVGPHNVYNIYDNCPNLDKNEADPFHSDKLPISNWFKITGKSTRWLRNYLADNMMNPHVYDDLDAMALADVSSSDTNPASGGGFDWTCGQFDALPIYFKRADVREALHLPSKSLTSTFKYNSSGPASITLYPDLLKEIRVLIYNGDSDTCVPYIGNEEWTSGLAETGVVAETNPWHPWYNSNTSSAPAGYATTYGDNFQFITVRLAGHQVPKNMPESALRIITALVNDKKM
jgi:hypothetical protein